jgi:5-oxopent-3-ene-1,2,5-tricarboxylate decarboxylase / 2-hydroxyhepta-2,4-diene-1,7-dioate isomerase
MSFQPAGTVYGALLNFRAEWDALGTAMNEAPYKAPPKAPVLYVKPANTWSAHGASVIVPAKAPQLEVGATIAMVMKASNQVGGYVLMNDWSIPHASFFRPPVKFKCLDGFLGIGDTLLDTAAAGDPSQFELEVRINGQVRQRVSFAHLVRDARQLLADVSAFMTLGTGDALMLGCDAGRPLAGVGDRVEIGAKGFGSLTQTLVPDAAQ